MQIAEGSNNYSQARNRKYSRYALYTIIYGWRCQMAVTGIFSQAPHIALYNSRMLILKDHVIISFVTWQIWNYILKYLKVSHVYANVKQRR